MISTEGLPALHPVKTFCIAHTDPVVPVSDDMIFLEIGPPGTLDPKRYKTVVNCFDLVPYGETYRRELGSVLGSIAAWAYIKTVEPHDFAVNLLTYRTFLTPEKRRAAFHKVLRMNFVSTHEARALGDLLIPEETVSMWRLPMPIDVGGTIAGNYAHNHHIEDLDLFLDIAVAEGVLTKDSNERLRARPHMMPGILALGMMPADVFCDLSDKLERVTRAFLPRFDAAGRDSYQIRAANFCHERLGSFLLEETLRARFGGYVDAHLGYVTRVDDDFAYSRGQM